MAAGKFGVNYCLDYGTSETSDRPYQHAMLVNYRLDYGTSETASDCRRLGDLVNCYLDYGTSETDPVLYINEKR